MTSIPSLLRFRVELCECCARACTPFALECVCVCAALTPTCTKRSVLLHFFLTVAAFCFLSHSTLRLFPHCCCASWCTFAQILPFTAPPLPGAHSSRCAFAPLPAYSFVASVLPALWLFYRTNQGRPHLLSKCFTKKKNQGEVLSATVLQHAEVTRPCGVAE